MRDIASKEQCQMQGFVPWFAAGCRPAPQAMLADLKEASPKKQSEMLENDATLEAIWRGEKKRDVEAVMAHAKADSKALLSVALAAAVEVLNRPASPFSFGKAEFDGDWSVYSAMTPVVSVPGRKNKRKMSLGLRIDTDTESGLSLYATFWMDDDDLGALEMVRVLAEASRGSDRQNEEWDPGYAVVAVIPFKDAMDEATGVVDFGRFLPQLRAGFERQTEHIMTDLAELARSP